LLQAVVTLEKIQLLHPNYRDVVDRLAQARAKLNIAAKTNEGQKHGAWLCPYHPWPAALAPRWAPGQAKKCSPWSNEKS
jgi:hypothetical protein